MWQRVETFHDRINDMENMLCNIWIIMGMQMLILERRMFLFPEMRIWMGISSEMKMIRILEIDQLFSQER